MAPVYSRSVEVKPKVVLTNLDFLLLVDLRQEDVTALLALPPSEQILIDDWMDGGHIAGS